MKQIYLLLGIMLGFQLQAQLTLTSQGNGVVNIDYGASNDYSLFDPQGATEVYFYMWVETTQTTPNLAAAYNDDWNNAGSLVVLNYSAAESKFIGEINFNTHDFIGEGVLPGNTQLDNFSFILRNQAGDRQSANLVATDYSFTATTTLGFFDITAKNNTFFSNGILHLADNYATEQVTVHVFNTFGQEITTLSVTNNQVDLSTLNKQMVIVLITTKTNKFFYKKLLIS